MQSIAVCLLLSMWLICLSIAILSRPSCFSDCVSDWELQNSC
uniref:Uncharacterized protein n=1 Tax=Setaria italica TaxID=4555 RepID=K3YNM6_SETIT